MSAFYARTVFFVADAARARHHYVTDLGFALDWDSGDGVFQVSLLGFELILNQVGEQTRARAGHGRVFVGLDEDQAEPFRKHVADKGIRMRRVEWGRPALVIDDVDGNELFFWRPRDDFSGFTLRDTAFTPADISAVHPVLMAREVTQSLDFYKRLGFAVAFQDDPATPRYAAVRRGPVELHLQWADAGQWAHDGDRPAYRFPTNDVDSLYAEFAAAGAIPARGEGPYAAPADTPWSTRELHLRDPGGNVLQFYGPPTLRAASAQ